MTAASPDPRAQALSRYLRERAAAFSLSADSTEQHHIALAGMALLDAAEAADRLPKHDARLSRLESSARLRWLPDGSALFVETDAVRRVIQGPLSGTSMTGPAILDLLLSSTSEP